MGLPLRSISLFPWKIMNNRLAHGMVTFLIPPRRFGCKFGTSRLELKNLLPKLQLSIHNFMPWIPNCSAPVVGDL